MASTFTLKRKTYSLEEGRFTGKRAGSERALITRTIGGAGLGAGLGYIGGKKSAGIGAIVGGILGLISGALARSEYNKKPMSRITTEEVVKNLDSGMRKMNEAIGEKKYNYALNELPENYDVTLKTNEDSAVLYFRPLSESELRGVNLVLDDYCFFYKNSDYVAEQVKGGGWIVTMKIFNVSDISSLVVELMDNLEFSVNFITAK